ncbi:polymorphic toxin type 15 domain-containing protein, partial [Streptococcus suis]
NVAGKLRHVDETLSTAAQNFSLNNIGFEPQLVSGAIPIPPPGRLSGLADNIQAFAKNLDGSVDEVVEAGAKSGDDVPRLKEIEVKFKQSQKHDEIEFTRQLTDQEAGMNQLTVQEYLDNRERYIAEGRAIEGNAAQQAARKKALADKVIEFREMGLSRSEAKIRAQEWLDTQAALHNPDQIAGGFADRIGGMGDTRINSSIGSQWRYRIDIVDDQIKRMASEMTPDQLRSTYLNVKLTY